MSTASALAMALQPTVFVVDDDSAVRAALTMLLESCGWSVHACASAEEFLAAYDPGVRGCLVLDLQMRGTSGADLQQILNERGIDLPVIVVTAYKDHPMTDRVRSAGARAVIAKPFDDGVLVHEIDAALREH